MWVKCKVRCKKCVDNTKVRCKKCSENTKVRCIFCDYVVYYEKIVHKKKK